jgi:hypothetical protein
MPLRFAVPTPAARITRPVRWMKSQKLVNGASSAVVAR